MATATFDEAVAHNKLLLEIVTPKGRALAVLADEVTAPGVTGEFGVMPGHITSLMALRTGIVSYRDSAGGEPKRCAIASGFAEAGPNRVSVITDEYVERPAVDPVVVRKDLADVQEKIGRTEAHIEAAEGPPRENPELRVLIQKENWLAAQLELYGDPPFAISRPFEEFGPPPPPPEDEVPQEKTADTAQKK
jgi:F-type H+-transporting ATPase subunit epsilon